VADAKLAREAKAAAAPQTCACWEMLALKTRLDEHLTAAPDQLPVAPEPVEHCREAPRGSKGAWLHS